MDNTEYIKKKYASIPEENKKAMLKAMQKYGENHWWESDDPEEIAKFQLFEDVLLVDFSRFHKGVEQLLQRPVWTHEFGLNIEGLRKEALEIIAHSNMGIEIVDIGNERRSEKILEGFHRLEEFCKKHNKKIIYLAKGR